jgi:hypothetical protein
VTRSVTLQQTADPATSDFLSLSHGGKRTRMNTTLVRYADGTTEQVDATSVSTYGTKAGYLELGAVASENDALKTALEVQASRADPAYQTTATIHPRSPATTPYTSFEVGDVITCPDETGTPVEMRVQSITMQEDDHGKIDWGLVLRDRQFETEERVDAWLRRMSDGAVFGGARVSSPKSKPDPVTQQIAALVVAEFSFDNVQLVASYSPRRPAEVSGNLVEIYVEVTTAGSTSTVVEVYLNGGAMTGGITLAAGETEAEYALDIDPIRANIDKLQARIVTAGVGAQGLDIQVRAI